MQLAEARPGSTIFTRFLPAMRPGDGQGAWKRYDERWASMTVERLGQDMVDLMPELRRFVPPAAVVDKHVDSPWIEPDLQERLAGRGVDALVVTGGETDVCVLAAVLGAVDRGYRVIVAHDALCSSSDETHDASLAVFHSRYGMQVEAVGTGTVLRNWSTRSTALVDHRLRARLDVEPSLDLVRAHEHGTPCRRWTASS